MVPKGSMCFNGLKLTRPVLWLSYFYAFFRLRRVRRCVIATPIVGRLLEEEEAPSCEAKG
jgi:hypothetical protein